MGHTQEKIECVICDSKETTVWWKCCPQHTTESGRDVVCQNCYNRLHPDSDSLDKKKTFVCYFGADFQKPVAKVEILNDDFLLALHDEEINSFQLASAIDAATGELKYLIVTAIPAQPDSNPYLVEL